jgi:hypothetical protein
MATIAEGDLQRVVEALPPRVVETLKAWPERMVVAGGMVRDVVLGVQWSDVDLFGEVEHGVVMESLGAENRIGGNRTVVEYLVDGQKVQYINVGAGGVKYHVAKRFDFTVCCAMVGWGRAGWYSWCSPEFLKDIQERRICFNTPYIHSGSALTRIVKLAGKGLRVDPKLLARVLAVMVGDTRQGVVRQVDVEKLEKDLERLLAGGPEWAEYERTQGEGEMPTTGEPVPTPTWPEPIELERVTWQPAPQLFPPQPGLPAAEQQVVDDFQERLRRLREMIGRPTPQRHPRWRWEIPGGVANTEANTQ